MYLSSKIYIYNNRHLKSIYIIIGEAERNSKLEFQISVPILRHMS